MEQLPHSIDAEQSVLGAVMINPEALDTVMDMLRPDDFYRADHQRIWKAILACSEANRPYDPVMLADFLDRAGALDEVGGMPYLGAIASNTPSAANVKHYAEVVRDRAIKRRLAQVADRIGDMARAPGSSRDALDKAQGEIMALVENAPTRGPRRASAILPDVIDWMEYRTSKAGELTGLSTGFVDLDRKTQGLHPQQLIIVAGRPSMGKTTFAMNIAKAAYTCRVGVAVFSMEMSAEELLDREAASVGGVEFSHIRSGDMDEKDWAGYNRAMTIIKDAPLFIDDSPALTVHEIRARSRRIKRECPELGLIVVDYLQLMSGEGERRESVISECSRGLKSLAKELKVPVVALSQLNRNLESRPDKRPRMSDLRESGAIEQDADLILFLYRDEVYDENSGYKGMAECIIGKQRNGELGMVPLTFQGNHCRFVSFSGNWPQREERPAAKKWRGGFDGFDD